MQRFIMLLLLMTVPVFGQNRQIDLQAWYDGYNEEYFLNQLPSAHVSYGENENNMGITLKEEDGIHIIISQKYNPSPREARLTLLHEICHVRLINTPMFDVHGPRFQECMHHLADQGVFDDLW